MDITLCLCRAWAHGRIASGCTTALHCMDLSRAGTTSWLVRLTQRGSLWARDVAKFFLHIYRYVVTGVGQKYLCRPKVSQVLGWSKLLNYFGWYKSYCVASCQTRATQYKYIYAYVGRELPVHSRDLDGPQSSGGPMSDFRTSTYIYICTKRTCVCNFIHMIPSCKLTAKRRNYIYIYHAI